MTEAKKKSKKTTDAENKVDEALATIASLEKKLKEQEEITKRAQSDYFRLKVDMDSYMQRAEEAKKKEKIDALVAMGSKLLPFITQLEQSIAHLPAELWDNQRVSGIRLIHQKSIQEVRALGIVPISTEIWTSPDLTLHMPINMQDTDDETLKGKIIQVVESGRKYDKDGVVQVISPSKIVVWT